MHLNVINNYGKSGVRLHYCESWLYNGANSFVRVGIRLWVCTAQVGRPFFNSNCHREWYPFHTLSMYCPGIICRTWCQSSNGVAFTEEMSWEKLRPAQCHIDSMAYRNLPSSFDMSSCDLDLFPNNPSKASYDVVSVVRALRRSESIINNKHLVNSILRLPDI